MNNREMTYCDFNIKIRVEEDANGNYKIFMKTPGLMIDWVDITEQASDEFQQKLFGWFFKETNNKESA